MDIPDEAVLETWEGASNKSLKLADMIESDSIKRGEKFDAMIVIPRGSYFPINIIARKLGFTASNLLHASIESYESGTIGIKGEFKLGQMPNDQEVKGKNLLIIDEVCDTGVTLNFLKEQLHKQGADLVRTGVLHYKPANSQTGFVPDWFVSETSDWIVYPWEVHETGSASSKVKKS